MTNLNYLWIGLLIWVGCHSVAEDESPKYAGNQWEKIVLQFSGEPTSESSDDNPFLNRRLQVTFKHPSTSITIPGFYAADGNAGETSADTGRIWQVHFRPNLPGTWTYEVSFRKGNQIAISDEIQAGEALAFDGETGSIEVADNPSSKGRLQVKGRYLAYAADGSVFIKGGADSPENFLAYHEFDGTYRGKAPEDRDGEATATESLHKYANHVQDWKSGDPTWQGEQGKGIIGALNYLAGKGMNSVYFLTMNIEGDGKDVWPYTGYDERERFDCSKLAQWETVFDHMDHLGLMLHVVTQETENEKLLDDGDTGLHRKLYYRELIARFGHHLGVTWNMGEENGPIGFSPNGQDIPQREAMVSYLKDHDPYQNLVVIHTHHNHESKLELFEPMLGFGPLDGMSIQNGNPGHTHETIGYWINASEEAGRPWVLMMDELGPADRGIDPDDREDNNQAEMRDKVLWGALMAGGAGVEWYFGYKNHNNDLGCEDWRSRDRLWDYTRHAITFFQDLPVLEMEGHDQLVKGEGNIYCFAKPGDVYTVYMSSPRSAKINLEGLSDECTLQWYNPRTGGELIDGGKIAAGGWSNLVPPSNESTHDWVALIRKSS